MDVSVIVPYRSDSGLREEIWTWLSKRWKDVYPDFELCVADSESEEFSRSEARNNAFADSTGDIVIIADADSIPTTRTLLACVDAVSKDSDVWAVAHDKYFMLNEEATVGVMAQPASLQISPPPTSMLLRPPFVSYAGMLVMHRNSYEEVGGYDERFKGWGLEDWAFRVSLDTLKQPLQRTPGALLHMYHGPPNGKTFGTPPNQYNQTLYKEYEKASGNTEAMTELIERRNG